MRVFLNVSYHASSGCVGCPSCSCLDLYLPERATKLVVFAHGGLWYSGSRRDIDEVCAALATHRIACATVDYPYSQDLGGCCSPATGCNQTYSQQARNLAAAVAQASSMVPGVNQVMLGGHSAGGHLALLLALRWADFAPTRLRAPDAYIGVEGIYDASLWDAYDESRFAGRFRCQTRQAFGEPSPNPAWVSGSPTAIAAARPPSGSALLLHSPEDDYVQPQQAVNLFSVLKAPPNGMHRLDTTGACVRGEHEDVIKGASARKLADCISNFTRGHDWLARRAFERHEAAR